MEVEEACRLTALPWIWQVAVCPTTASFRAARVAPFKLDKSFDVVQTPSSRMLNSRVTLQQLVLSLTSAAHTHRAPFRSWKMMTAGGTHLFHLLGTGHFSAAVSGNSAILGNLQATSPVAIVATSCQGQEVCERQSLLTMEGFPGMSLFFGAMLLDSFNQVTIDDTLQLELVISPGSTCLLDGVLQHRITQGLATIQSVKVLAMVGTIWNSICKFKVRLPLSIITLKNVVPLEVHLHMGPSAVTCPSGWISSGGQQATRECQACPAGSFAVPGASSCTVGASSNRCGMFLEPPDTARAEACPAGRFNQEAGTADCLVCPPGPLDPACLLHGPGLAMSACEVMGARREQAFLLRAHVAAWHEEDTGSVVHCSRAGPCQVLGQRPLHTCFLNSAGRLDLWFAREGVQVDFPSRVTCLRISPGPGRRFQLLALSSGYLHAAVARTIFRSGLDRCRGGHSRYGAGPSSN